MDRKEAGAVVHDAGGGLFIAVTPSGHAQVLETDSGRASAATPVELLLVALGSCTAVDVITILRKKRERVTDYRVEVRGERRAEHPRAYTRMEVRHFVRGHVHVPHRQLPIRRRVLTLAHDGADPAEMLGEIVTRRGIHPEVGQIRNRFPTARELNSKLWEWLRSVDS